MPDAADLSSQMVTALATVEPQLDTSIGTPVRKILDVIAEQLAAAYSDQYLASYTFDINSKSGSDLDDFVLMFGFTRFQAQRAVGIETFSRTTAATQDYTIPVGTQVTISDGSVVFSTTAPAVLATGQTTVDVPIQAVVGGTSGNLTAHALATLASPVDGIMSVTNNSPTTGGTDYETDAQLITRFKSTVFRGLAGTADMFAAVALESSAGQTATSQAIADAPEDTTDMPVTNVNVLGASQRWREQLQVESGAATSTIPAANAKYIYPGTQFFGPDIDNGGILVPGMAYSFDNTVIPPVVHSLAGGLTDDDLYDLDFEYSSSASRNDPANGIANRVDIWVNGSRNVEASETTYFRTARVFNNTSGDPLNVANFVRLKSGGTTPTVGNYFVQLAFGPIVAFPSTLTINGVIYTQNTDYWVVHDNTAFGYAQTSLYGLEWISSHAPANGQQIVLSSADTYTYNAIPSDVQDRVRQWRLVTTDVWAHAAKRQYYILNFVIMYSAGYDQTTVNTAVESAMANFLASKGFDAALQVSDIHQTAHNVDGVDNIRLSNQPEATPAVHYGIEQVSSTGSHIAFQQVSGRPIDIQFGDNAVPVLYDCTFTVKAANTFSGS